MHALALNTHLAASIAASVLGEAVLDTTPIIGKGSVNAIVVVCTAAQQVVVRMNTDQAALDEYHKEQWCIEQAARYGIPGPQVIAVGQWQTVAYMLQAYIAGTPGGESGDTTRIWHRLGQYAHVIHAIPVTGWGEQLADASRGHFHAPKHHDFDDSWPSFVAYNMHSLTADDPLLSLSVLTPTQLRQIKTLFESLLSCTFTFGLNHGDLTTRNTVVDPSGSVHLLDWGSARVQLVPQWDIVQLLTTHLLDGTPTTSELHAFLRGYGISAEAFSNMYEQVSTLMLLRAFDTLRWAIDQQPQHIPAYAEYARKVVQYKFQQPQ